MTATHNALLGALSRHSHLSEFSEPLEVRGNIKTPTQRRDLALQNLTGVAALVAADFANVARDETFSPGSGFTGTGTIHKGSVVKRGNLVKTEIFIDLTGLHGSTTDLDIIGGVGAANSHIGQITAAINGTIVGGRMTCIEVPAGGADDIDLYAATEATGTEDAGIAALAETALITSGGAWAANTVKMIDTVAADKYLYLTNGEAGTVGTYTAGKFLIELWGYDA